MVGRRSEGLGEGKCLGVGVNDLSINTMPIFLPDVVLNIETFYGHRKCNKMDYLVLLIRNLEN